jgi:hypothetical protein
MIEKTIKDLLRARPLGPEHPRKKIIYTKSKTGERWCSKECDYVDTYELKPSEKQWGYTDEELFKLGFKDKWDVKKYILARDFPGKDEHSLGRQTATLTRRTNRLWSRVEKSIGKITKSGGRGIYKVYGSYSWSIGYIFANDQEEAQHASKLYFGYLIESVYTYSYPRVKFIQFGTVQDAIPLNEIHRCEVVKKIEADQKRINDLSKEIDAHKTRLDALATVEAQQVKIES